MKFQKGFFQAKVTTARDTTNAKYLFKLSFSETCVTLDCLYRGKPSAGAENSPLKLSMDITIAIIRSSTNAISQPSPPPLYPSNPPEMKKDQFLVPHRQLSGSEISGWKPSFPIAEKNAFCHFDPILTRCYRLLKLLVLLVAHTDDGNPSRKTKPSSYAIKTCLFKFVTKNRVPWNERHMGLYCRGICNEFLEERNQINSFFDHSLPVYIIKNESREVMTAIKNRLESIRHCCYNFHSTSQLCQTCCISKCNLM